MSKVAVLSAALVLASTVTAAAQPGQTPPTALPEAPRPADGELSEGTALALSLGGTLASYALIAVSAEDAGGGDDTEALATIGVFGTMLAPSAGHWYAGTFFTRGLGLRAAGVTAAFAGAAIAFSECPLFAEEEDCHESPLGATLVIAGAVAWIGGTVDDIVQAPRRVRRHNERLHALTFAPMAGRDGGGGVVVAGRF